MTRDQAREKVGAAMTAAIPEGWVVSHEAINRHVAGCEALGLIKFDADVTPTMVEAGVAILWELAGEVSKATLAKEVFQAMDLARCREPSP